MGVKGALSPPPPPEALVLNFNLLLINDLKIDVTNCVKTLGSTGGGGGGVGRLAGVVASPPPRFFLRFFLDD